MIIFSHIGLGVQQNLFRESVAYEPLVKGLNAIVIQGILKQ